MLPPVAEITHAFAPCTDAEGNDNSDADDEQKGIMHANIGFGRPTRAQINLATARGRCSTWISFGGAVLGS